MTKVIKKESPKTTLKIKFGFPIIMMKWETIKILINLTCIFNVIGGVLSFGMIYAAYKIKISIGDYLNMVTTNEGNILPLLMFVSGMTCLPLNVISIILLFQTKKPKRSHGANNALFILLITKTIIVKALSGVAVGSVINLYGIHGKSYDGIINAMKLYSSDVHTKSRIDRLQIEFQCCGSKSYKDWFPIRWFTSNLRNRKIDETGYADDVPFSCCSVRTPYPCIHHGITTIGQQYINIQSEIKTISQNGCYDLLIDETRIVAWKVAYTLFGFSFLQGIICITSRLVQTSHIEKYKFERINYWHTAWIIGIYKGKKKKIPPKLPPLPPELMED